MMSVYFVFGVAVRKRNNPKIFVPGHIFPGGPGWSGGHKYQTRAFEAQEFSSTGYQRSLKAPMELPHCLDLLLAPLELVLAPLVPLLAPLF